MQQDDPTRHCPKCGQALRFPNGIGGVLMACPVCGHRFASPFRLGGTAKSAVSATHEEKTPDAPMAPVALPTVEDTPKPPSATSKIAAKVAALYAANS